MRIGPAFLQTFAVQLLQTIASLFAGIVIARGLGPIGQGQYAVLVAVVALVATLAAAGQFEGNVLTSAGQRDKGRVLVARSVMQGLLAGGVVFVTIGLWRSTSLDGDGSLPSLLTLIVVGEVLALLFRGINLGQHQITAYNAATLIQRIAYLIVLSTVGIAGGLRLTTVLWAWLAAVTINVFLTGVGIWRRTESAPLSWKALKDGWLSSLTRGIRALVTICLTLLLLRTDVYMLGRMLGPAAVGQISVASTFGEYLWYIPSILASVLFATVAANRGPATISKISRATRSTILLLTPISLALLLFGQPLITLIYSEAYGQAGAVFALLVPGMLAIALHLVVDSYFAGSGYPPISYLAAAAALVVKVLLNLTMVPWLGLEGAALSTSCVYILLFWAKVLALRKETRTPLREILLPTRQDVFHGAAIMRDWLRGSWRAVSAGRA